jgi:hypothetical protein
MGAQAQSGMWVWDAASSTSTASRLSFFPCFPNSAVNKTCQSDFHFQFQFSNRLGLISFVFSPIQLKAWGKPRII